MRPRGRGLRRSYKERPGDASATRDLCGRFDFRLMPAAMNKGYVRGRLRIMLRIARKPLRGPSQRAIDPQIFPRLARN